MPEKKTSEFFDSYARDFDAIYGSRNTVLNGLINRFFRKSMRARFERTIEGCRPFEGRTVIDIGCGPGHYSVYLAEHGAGRVLGLDFSDKMIELARKRAEREWVAEICRFENRDFISHPVDDKFDYAIVMGLMDYIEDAEAFVSKVLSITGARAFFSFPAAGGLLAWQRKLRYRWKCKLFMYDEERINKLFRGKPYRKMEVERICRDFFVTIHI